MKIKFALALVALGWGGRVVVAAEAPAPAPAVTRTADVVYGHKAGMALVMEVFRPANANGAAVLSLSSGGWASNYSSPNPKGYDAFLSRGYTVFVVWHGSQPKFGVPEIVQDIQRAARFVRFNAARFGIDPSRLGVTGTSSGGHLSLMLGLTGGPGAPDAKDPIDRVSSAVQAIACFCPPTDFGNWTAAGDEQLLLNNMDPKYKAAWSPQGDTRAGREALWRVYSPIALVKASMPPTLIFQGDADQTVPIYQGRAFEAAARAAGGTVKLVVRAGKDHNWPEMATDRGQFADWFDQYLRAPAPVAK